MSNERFTKADAADMERLHSKLLAECQQRDDTIVLVDIVNFLGDDRKYAVEAWNCDCEEIRAAGNTLPAAVTALLHKLAEAGKAPLPSSG